MKQEYKKLSSDDSTGDILQWAATQQLWLSSEDCTLSYYAKPIFIASLYYVKRYLLDGKRLEDYTPLNTLWSKAYNATDDDLELLKFAAASKPRPTKTSYHAYICNLALAQLSRLDQLRSRVNFSAFSSSLFSCLYYCVSSRQSEIALKNTTCVFEFGLKQLVKIVPKKNAINLIRQLHRVQEGIQHEQNWIAATDELMLLCSQLREMAHVRTQSLWGRSYQYRINGLATHFEHERQVVCTIMHHFNRCHFDQDDLYRAMHQAWLVTRQQSNLRPLFQLLDACIKITHDYDNRSYKLKQIHLLGESASAQYRQSLNHEFSIARNINFVLNDALLHYCQKITIEVYAALNYFKRDSHQFTTLNHLKNAIKEQLWPIEAHRLAPERGSDFLWLHGVFSALAEHAAVDEGFCMELLALARQKKIGGETCLTCTIADTDYQIRALASGSGAKPCFEVTTMLGDGISKALMKLTNSITDDVEANSFAIAKTNRLRSSFATDIMHVQAGEFNDIISAVEMQEWLHGQPLSQLALNGIKDVWSLVIKILHFIKDNHHRNMVLTDLTLDNLWLSTSGSILIADKKSLYQLAGSDDNPKVLDRDYPFTATLSYLSDQFELSASYYPYVISNHSLAISILRLLENCLTTSSVSSIATIAQAESIYSKFTNLEADDQQLLMILQAHIHELTNVYSNKRTVAGILDHMQVGIGQPLCQSAEKTISNLYDVWGLVKKIVALVISDESLSCDNIRIDNIWLNASGAIWVMNKKHMACANSFEFIASNTSIAERNKAVAWCILELLNHCAALRGCANFQSIRTVETVLKQQLNVLPYAEQQLLIRLTAHVEELHHSASNRRTLDYVKTQLEAVDLTALPRCFNPMSHL